MYSILTSFLGFVGSATKDTLEVFGESEGMRKSKTLTEGCAGGGATGGGGGASGGAWTVVIALPVSASGASST